MISKRRVLTNNGNQLNSISSKVFQLETMTPNAADGSKCVIKSQNDIEVRNDLVISTML